MPRKNVCANLVWLRQTLLQERILILVGARGFEPPTSSTPLKRATELRYAPTPTISIPDTLLPRKWSISGIGLAAQVRRVKSGRVFGK